MNKLLEIEHLSVSYDTYAGTVQAVRDISFEIGHNQRVAIVGESGCGKSVTAKAIMGLIDVPGKLGVDSIMKFEGKPLDLENEKEWRAYRGNKASMIFQDALVALNPTMKIGKQITEGLDNHTNLSKEEKENKALEMLKLVGIPNAEGCLKMYPHELSGGMRQRVMIASALIMSPQLLIADEPTTALDVTIQAQILTLMKQIQAEYHMSVILITHDLGVVADFAEEIYVMYAGKIVERGKCNDIFYHPKHPYTWSLLHAVPKLTQEKEKPLTTIKGTVLGMIDPPEGCAFCNRCPYAMGICKKQMPPMFQAGEQHAVSCWLQLKEVDKSMISYLSGGTEE